MLFSYFITITFIIQKNGRISCKQTGYEKDRSSILKFYHNPSESMVSMDLFIKKNKGNAVIELTDMTGNKVLSRNLTNDGYQKVEMNLEDVSKGSYIYTLYQKGEKITN